MFPTLYINRTRYDRLNDAAKKVIQAEIEGMTHEEAKAALFYASHEEEHSSVLKSQMEEVPDLPTDQRATILSDDDLTNSDARATFIPLNPSWSALLVNSYVSQCPSVKYEVPHDREATVELTRTSVHPFP